MKTLINITALLSVGALWFMAGYVLDQTGASDSATGWAFGAAVYTMVIISGLFLFNAESDGF